MLVLAVSKEVMRYRREISGGGLALWLIGSLLLSRAGLAQEGGGVEFDPRETGELTLTFTTVLIGLLLALGCIGAWRLLTWQLENRRARIRWAKFRLWWSTVMLFWGWVMLAMFSKSESWAWPVDAVFFLFGLFNFPALILIGVIVGLLNESFHLPLWLRIVVGSATMWVGNYFTVRLAEWRAWSNVPVALHLADDDAGPKESA